MTGYDKAISALEGLLRGPWCPDDWDARQDEFDAARAALVSLRGGFVLPYSGDVIYPEADMGHPERLAEFLASEFGDACLEAGGMPTPEEWLDIATRAIQVGGDSGHPQVPPKASEKGPVGP